jgi:hypothetical protein
MAGDATSNCAVNGLSDGLISGASALEPRNASTISRMANANGQETRRKVHLKANLPAA